MADQVAIPEAPKHFPADEAKEWRRRYAQAYAEIQKRSPEGGDQSAAHQYARCEANRMLRVTTPESYEGAMALPAHQVLRRETVDGVLRVVTSDGRKYLFDAPVKEEKEAEAKDTPPAKDKGKVEKPVRA